MADRFVSPKGAPPAHRPQSQSGVKRPLDEQPAHQRHRLSRVGEVPSATRAGSSSHVLASNNPFRDGILGVSAPDQRTASQTVSSSQPQTSLLQAPLSVSSGRSSHSSDVEMSEEEFLPPPGPPPGREPISSEVRALPGQLPVSLPSILSARAPSVDPPPYDPWVGPDDSLRPPPPMWNERSPTANADPDAAARAHAWCDENPLWPAPEHDDVLAARIAAGDLRLTVPPNTTDVTQYFPALGRSYVRTMPHLDDTVLLSDIPLYAASCHSPIGTGRAHTLYFEVSVLRIGQRHDSGDGGGGSQAVQSGLALGLVAPPYPAWRLPGWHRGSLGVHSDDGRRYVDNSFGGKDFAAPFAPGDVVGLGMTYSPPVHGDRVAMRCKVFLTRNGRLEGSWDLHEERDTEEEGGSVTGLEGEHDLLAAVGVFGSVEFECVFKQKDWRYTLR